MRSCRRFRVGRRAILLRRGWVAGWVLGDKKNVAVIFEGLVQFDAGGVVDSFQHLYLIEEEIGVLYVLLGYFFDSPPLAFGALLPGFINNSVCAFA